MNTVSLFVNGVRACAPKLLPESMKGKALYPAVSFRNATVQAIDVFPRGFCFRQVHFGPEPMRRLPFTCHCWQQVAKAHSEVKAEAVPKDGKYEVLLPVALPDEGTFDWVDQFLSKNRCHPEVQAKTIRLM